MELDYIFYTKEYGGTLVNEKDFPFFSKKSIREIQKACNQELCECDFTDQVKMVACELVDFLYNNNKTISKNLSSVSVDGVSESYGNNAELSTGKNQILSALPQELTRYL